MILRLVPEEAGLGELRFQVSTGEHQGDLKGGLRK